MNQKNGKNSFGIDICFEDLDNPIDLFKKWFSKAEESEINDPNAVAVATSNKDNQPNVRILFCCCGTNLPPLDVNPFLKERCSLSSA